MSAEVSTKGVHFVAGWEGFRSCPYWDHIGKVWTRGYGETEGIHSGSRCVTEAEARWNLRWRLDNQYLPAVPRLGRLKQQEKDALASFAYNCGPGSVNNPSFSTLARRLQSREGRSFRKRKRIYREELPRWTSGGVAGLVKRRAAEVALACKGDYSGRP